MLVEINSWFDHIIGGKYNMVASLVSFYFFATIIFLIFYIKARKKAKQWEKAFKKLEHVVNDDHKTLTRANDGLQNDLMEFLKRWDNEKRQSEKDFNELQADFNQAINERNFYVEENGRLRDEHREDTDKMRRALVKMQTRWIMHYKSVPILVQAVKSLVNLNTNLWGGKTPKKWPRGWILKGIRLYAQDEENNVFMYWNVLDQNYQALDWIKTTPEEWKVYDK
jgi:hypothetical protein